jgi:hypothetical protein
VVELESIGGDDKGNLKIHSSGDQSGNIGSLRRDGDYAAK